MNIFEILSLPFMQRALLGGLLVAILAAVLGVFITLRRESFFSDAVAHASLSGVAVGFLLAVEPIPIALVVGVIMAVSITYLKKTTNISTDALIGIFYSILFAIGIVILNLSPTYKPELSTYLFGSILSVNQIDLIYALVTFVVSIVLISWLYKKLLYITFDPEAAYLRGIKVNHLEYLLNILAATTIIISIKIVGIILVTALLVIPATTAKITARNFKQMIPISIVQSVVSFIFGILLSFYLNTPIGATIVIVSGAIFMFIFLATKLRPE
ncbi:MAG: metal ABC transporter permease [Candidatus Dojkabacteria bacterium]